MNQEFWMCIWLVVFTVAMLINRLYFSGKREWLLYGFSLSVLILFIFSFLGCDAPENNKITHEFKPIQRVMMHERGEYTVFVMDEEGVMTEVRVNFPTLKVDAAQGDPMMLETIRDGWSTKYIIHLHKPDEINGAGWSRTVDENTEKGQTTVIE